MIQPQVFDLDQQRILDADEAAEQLYLDGVNDGFEGRKPASIELDYLKGYGEGTKRFLEEGLKKLSEPSHLDPRLPPVTSIHGSLNFFCAKCKSVLKCETAFLTGMESQIQEYLDEPF